MAALVEFQYNGIVNVAANETYITLIPKKFNSWRATLDVLHKFCEVSGLRVNMSKSQIMGVNIVEDIVQHLAQVAGCPIGVWPLKYLGLLLGGNPRRADFWAPVVDKISRRLAAGEEVFYREGVGYVS